MTTFRRGDFIVGSDMLTHFVLYSNEDDRLVTVVRPEPAYLGDIDDSPPGWKVDRLDTRFAYDQLTRFDDLPEWSPYVQDYFGISWAGYESKLDDEPLSAHNIEERVARMVELFQSMQPTPEQILANMREAMKE